MRTCWVTVLLQKNRTLGHHILTCGVLPRRCEESLEATPQRHGGSRPNLNFRKDQVLLHIWSWPAWDVGVVTGLCTQRLRSREADPEPRYRRNRRCSCFGGQCRLSTSEAKGSASPARALYRAEDRGLQTQKFA